MKKIFYILASAIVALGAVACDNQDLDNIAPSVGGDSLSFSATIDNTKTDLGENNVTTWVVGDDVVFEGYEDFVFEYDGENFTCTVDGVTAALGQAEGLTAWYNKAGIDSAAGTAGAQLKAEGCSFKALNPSFKFAVQNAFLKFTSSEEVTLKGAGMFSTGDEITIKGTGETQYVAVNPTASAVEFSYWVNGVQCKVVSMNFEAKNIYNLGNLSAMDAVAEVGGVQYASLDKAIAAANGSTIELLADIEGTVTISTACTINAGTYNINITVEGAFVKTVEGNVHTIEAAAKVWLLGDWNGWAAPFYMKEEGNYYVAHNVVIEEGQGFKFNDGTMYLGGASTANAWNSFSGSDIKLSAATYDIYVSKRNGAWCAVTAGSEAPALDKRYMYLKPDVWDTSSPKYVAWSMGGSNADKDLSFSWAMYEGDKNYQVLEISDYTQFYIKRMSSDGKTKWNEVGPVTIGDKSLVTITGWSTYKLGTIVP